MGLKERIRVFLNVEEKEESPAPTELVRSRVVTLGGGQTITSRGSTEERHKLKDLEKIYRMDGLVFGIINKYTRDVTGVGFNIISDDEPSRQAIEGFCRDRSKGFDKMLRFAVRDSLVYGFAIFEIVYNRGKTDILRILRIDPKSVEFRRKGGDVERDKYGFPLGYTYTDINGKEIPLEKNQVAFFTFFQLNEGDIGVSPLEVLYKPILFKLNVEEATGEALWRLGFPPMVATVGDDKHHPSEKEIESLARDLVKLKSRTAFVLPHWTKVGPLQLGQPANVESYLNYFNNLIRECLGIPRIESREIGAIDYERTVLALQNEIGEQVEEQIFSRVVNLKKLSSIPTIKFKEYSAAMRLSKARRLGVYGRAGLLSWDEDLEKSIRIDESLPYWKQPLSEEEKIERRDRVKGQRRVRMITKDNPLSEEEEEEGKEEEDKEEE